MGITLYFMNKYEEAFEILSKATQTFKLNGNVGEIYKNIDLANAGWISSSCGSP